MEGDQLFFSFIEEEPILIKDIHYAYLDELPNDCYRDNYTQYSEIPKQLYRIYKTGGYNRYRLKDGPVYPFVQNMKTKKIMSVVSKITDGYPTLSLNFKENDKQKGMVLKIHRLAAFAFIENVHNLPAVDHINKNILDYRVENLRWISISDNNKASKRQQKNLDWHARLAKEGRIL